ncbi:short-chain dehydrogenase [Kocuria dechangensis]|uniref:Short-chain dehydrogenase n=1 Tax=Kocuria dechangensis TaxID=1176249 RepID=A0A917GIS3_9MICC|nr:SDR family NAD(P)-dependent oxidoreductase [Kocuria dechangensis]GGG47412.1 short-chain dehydrogenase [Kocuria dechangensis]
MRTFTGRTAVVTGGASGIGYAMADRFADEGMNVVVADIEQQALDTAVASLARPGVEVLGVRTDVSDLDSVQALADATIERFGRVDLVCNNAGVETGGTFLNIPESAWRWVMDVNFFGVLHGCQVFLPLLEQQEEGHIVNTASVAAFNSGTPTMTPYCASKFAVLGLSECLDIELRGRGSTVGVSLLAPGPVKTRMTEAERNRPRAVPKAAEPERLAVIENLARLSEEVGLDPADVADQVLGSVRENAFFVLTHPDSAVAGLERRLEWVRTGTAPAARTAGT